MFCEETNNGDDYIVIAHQGDGVIHLGVGHQCVSVIDAIVPVDFIIAAIVAAIDGWGVEGTINTVQR